MRVARQANGQRMLEADEIRLILDNANDQLKAMTLLGVNAGLGNTDIGGLTIGAVDLDKGWLTYPRPKTGVMRRVPLWPETVEALRVVLEKRKQPKNEADNDILFLTKYGGRWTRTTEIKDPDKDVKRTGPKAKRKIVGGTAADKVGSEFAKLLTKLGIKRPRVSFYTLRHVFETIGGDSKDPVAVSAIMGHVDDSMSGHYRERVSDERLLAVTKTVRTWLFGK